jgi:hypothetical protein
VRTSLLLSLAGSAILAGFSVAALPFSRGLFHLPRTPYDASAPDSSTGAYILLQRAEALIPRDASVVARAEPPDATTDTYLHRFAVALLPGRKIVPAALWSVPTDPAVLREADYEIVVGKPPLSPAGRLLLSTPEGSVWKRER